MYARGGLDDAFTRSLAHGARLFATGEFFAAHEAWEERWRVAEDPGERRALQGLIQVAAGFHKLLVMGNPASAVRLLERGLAKLEAGRGVGFDRAGFCAGVRACARAIAAGRFDAADIPRIELDAPR